MLFARYVTDLNSYVCSFKSQKLFDVFTELGWVKNIGRQKSVVEIRLTYDEIDEYFEFVENE